MLLTFLIGKVLQSQDYFGLSLLSFPMLNNNLFEMMQQELHAIFRK